ncbi:MAG: HigA family addiction module antidote protein [Flavobacteriales bacterium]|nr:HigA family addiction module antidote protein [Flavobacteriales bacterium]
MATTNQYFPQSVPHPGETLAEKLEEMSMGPKEFAIRTGKPEKTITAILKGESSITPDMAVLFETVTSIPAQFWLNAQRGYDEYLARIRHSSILEEATDWSRSFPIAAMAKLGWIEKKTRIQDKANELLTFFGVASHDAWEEYYYNQKLKVAFRISLKSTKEPYAISAWLRQGEIEAANIQVNDYSAQKFQSTLLNIKKLMVSHPDDLFIQLQQLCASAGVKVVHTPCLPKAPLNGSTRWINDTPLIQLTGRYKRNDIFWFTFFHEAGHILLHGKKDVFLEAIDYSDKDLQKEDEADAFATKWTLSEKEEDEIVSNYHLTSEMVVKYAKKFKTHPAIIIGRLQHRKLIHPSVGREFIETVEFS